jgi:Ribonuclease G/E
MTPKEAQQHIEDIKNEIADVLFLKVTLEREIDLLTPKIESKIVKPRSFNISNLRKEDLEVDLAPIHMANMEMVQLRKQFYYARQDLANVLVTIEAKKNLLQTYFQHIKQELDKQAKPLTDEMIFDRFQKAQSLTNMSEEEKATFKGLSDIMLKALNSGKEARIEFYETLQNFILQHK